MSSAARLSDYTHRLDTLEARVAGACGTPSRVGGRRSLTANRRASAALELDGIDQAPFVRRREISNTPEHTTAALREDGVRPRLPSAAFETAFFAAAARLQPERPAVITGYR